MSDMWLDPQHIEEEGDKVLVWKEGTKFPTTYSSKPSTDRARDRSPLPRFTNYRFARSWVKTMMAPKAIPQVKFPSFIQGDTETIPIASTNHAHMDLCW